MTGQVKPALLSVRDLTVEFRSRRHRTSVVNGASLDIAPGETVGLVGESGSGKTTLGRAVLGLVPPAAGTITFDQRDITHAKGAARRVLARDIQVVFQDPYGSLNPAMTVSSILAESLRARGRLRPAEAAERIANTLERVALPASAADRYPGAFSGGQRQRLAIARALMPSPRLVICDEATSALDLSVQAQILNLLRDLQRQYSLSYLFIGHNLDVVRFASHRIVVMYRGLVMEEGPADEVARTPRHPYTRLLVAAEAGRAGGRAEAPPAAGCPFAPRCHLATDICRTQVPPLVRRTGFSIACHHQED
jgi:peptide/nickel transport system ATP-binding protein